MTKDDRVAIAKIGWRILGLGLFLLSVALFFHSGFQTLRSREAARESGWTNYESHEVEEADDQEDLLSTMHLHDTYYVVVDWMTPAVYAGVGIVFFALAGPLGRVVCGGREERMADRREEEE